MKLKLLSLSFPLCSPDQSKNAAKTLVQTLGTTQVQHPGHPIRLVHDTPTDRGCPEACTALAGVWHAEGVWYHQTGGADPQRGAAGP